MAELVLKDECYRVMGACFEVYKEKGCGFREPVYQECLEIEFEMSDILAISQEPQGLSYKGRPLTKKYIPDFICFDELILEIKTVKVLTDEHRAQVLNYLRATNKQLGLLVNFASHPKLEWERIAYTQKR